MAENQAKHRQGLELASLKKFSAYQTQSLWQSFATTVCSLIVGCFLVLHSSQTAGLIVMIGGIGVPACGLLWERLRLTKSSSNQND